MKGITPAARACPKLICAWKASQAVPKAYRIRRPSTIPANSKYHLPAAFSIIRPLTIQTGMKPMRYPPVGPKSLAGPPAKPENTGSPTSPKRRYTM